jgi:hypothetical protein
LGGGRRALTDLGTTDPVIPTDDFEKIKAALFQASSEIGARPELLHSALARAVVRCVWAGCCKGCSTILV